MQILGSLQVLGQELGVWVMLPETLMLRLPEIAWEHETPPRPSPKTGKEKKKKKRGNKARQLAGC